MDYLQTIEYLYARLPMFTRVGASAIKKDLHNTLALCAALGDPQHQFRSVHVGGTNGKGSTSHMLAAVLQTAGYKTGLYTSPHLLDFRERIRINGEMIDPATVTEFVARIQPLIEQIEPSFFEVTVAMAFEHFARQQVDIAIVEVGLGGRLDSTNIITPLLSIITNIGLDHTQLLGSTLREIAAEKAGIIKPGVPVVIGQHQPEVSAVFGDKARGMQAKLVTASDEWISSTSSARAGSERIIRLSRADGTDEQQYTLDLAGIYQLKNVKTVRSAVEELRLQGFDIKDIHIAEALRNVQKLTGFAGRWQVLGQNPLVIADTGHNADGIREVVEQLESLPFKQLHLVLGMVKDKDASAVLDLLPRSARYYFCQPNLERARPVQDLTDEARAAGLNGNSYPSVNAALRAATRQATSNDVIFIGGSTFVVAEALPLFS